MRKAAILVVSNILLAAVAACGGGGGSDNAPPPPPPPPPGPGGSGGPPVYTPGVFRASSEFAARCLAPRTGQTHPKTGQPWPDVAGTALLEKHFLRSWTNEMYLWFDEVPDNNPAITGGTSSGVLQYYDLLKTNALTASGRAKDEFHFTYETNEYLQLAYEGVSKGHGISWSIVKGWVPRQVVVEYVQAGTPADLGGVRRGATLLSIDGVDVVNDPTQAGVSLINDALFAPAAGSTHTMVFRDRGSAGSFTVSLPAQDVAFEPVPVVDSFEVGDATVGYLLFNDHSATAEAELKGAIEQLAAAQVEELVLDLRYNGGGFLDIASELAFMIAGPAATFNRTFEQLQFNSRHPTLHPLTRQPITPKPFFSTTQDFSLPGGQPLPSLNLDRVHVLTSSRTCSASESIINGLRGIGIAVIQIGADTCGKPYGFYAWDNCGTTYFSIQFRGVNDVNFGDYADGFSATRTTGDPMANLPGCPAVDDLGHDLGDPLEGQLQVALSRMATGICPATPPVSVRPQTSLWPADSPVVYKPSRPWENNRILR